MGRFVTQTKIDFIQRELGSTQSHWTKPKNGVCTLLLMCLLVGIMMQTQPVQAESLAGKDIRTVLEMAKALLLKSTYYSKLQPVVDLVQVVKRPFKSPNSLLTINDNRLAFVESKMYSTQSLFLLVRYHVAPGEEMSHSLFDITLSQYVFLNTTTLQFGLQSVDSSKEDNIIVQTLAFQGPLANCNLKLSIKTRARAPQRNRQQRQRKRKPREWWVAGETVPLAIQTEDQRKYFQIRKLGRIIIDEDYHYPYITV